MFFRRQDPGLIDANGLKKLIDDKESMFLLDVREPHEYQAGHIPGAVNVSVNELQARVNELPQDMDMRIVAYCASGMRSGRAAAFLRQYGYKNVFSLKGGYNNWASTGNPTA